MAREINCANFYLLSICRCYFVGQMPKSQTDRARPCMWPEKWRTVLVYNLSIPIFPPVITFPLRAFDRICLSTHDFAAVHHSPSTIAHILAARDEPTFWRSMRRCCAPCGGCRSPPATDRHGRRRRHWGFAAVAFWIQHHRPGNG